MENMRLQVLWKGKREGKGKVKNLKKCVVVRKLGKTGDSEKWRTMKRKRMKGEKTKRTERKRRKDGEKQERKTGKIDS